MTPPYQQLRIQMAYVDAHQTIVRRWTGPRPISENPSEQTLRREIRGAEHDSIYNEAAERVQLRDGPDAKWRDVEMPRIQTRVEETEPIEHPF